MRLIPALDLLSNSCVRLTHGDFATAITYSLDPVAVAQAFASAGCTHLHVVDLDGARTRTPRHLHLLQSITESTPLQVDFSGGLTTTADVAAALAAGAAQVVIGSQAVRDPALVRSWLAELGAERFIIGADFRDNQVLTQGWQQTSALALDGFIESWLEAGATQFLCTDVSRDGTLGGPATARYAALAAAFPTAKLLASGGVSSTEDLDALRPTGVAGVIIGKAFYEGRITLNTLQASQWS
jgi:phosphoribosylformimino-5-aminoimidazole carboxamide ribotide isomerase